VETLADALTRQANTFPDASPVQVRHPLTADDTDEMLWPWLTGLLEGMVAPGEWDIVVTDDRLVEGLDAGGSRSTRSAATRPRRSACDSSRVSRPPGLDGPGRSDRGLLVVVAQHTQDGRGRGVTALFRAAGDDEPGGDVAQAEVLTAQVQSRQHVLVGDGAADGLAAGAGGFVQGR
jgi:hypothetical protein